MFELVSISAGAASFCLVNDCLNDRYLVTETMLNSTDPTYEFYNVMYIEWHRNIAYRKALGRVWKREWEDQATEWIDLVLG